MYLHKTAADTKKMEQSLQSIFPGVRTTGTWHEAIRKKYEELRLSPVATDRWFGDLRTGLVHGPYHVNDVHGMVKQLNDMVPDHDHIIKKPFLVIEPN